MKLAILGTGKIVTDGLFAMDAVETIEKVAILARPHSIEKGKALAEKHHIAKVYTDYAELLETSGADAVYIGLINSVHYEYAKAALMSGKHVILEKPFTGYAKEAEELRDLAESKGLMALEAITVLHSDVYDRMKQDLQDIGKVRMVMANFSQYSSRYDEYLRGEVTPPFDRLRQGGCLYDINVYNIHYCVGLFGEPKDVKYYANIGFNGTDTSGTLVMSYDGFSAVCTGAKDSDGLSYVSIQGEKGNMIAIGKPNMLTELTVTKDAGACGEVKRDAAGATIRNTVTETLKAPIVHHRMVGEFRDFARIIDTGDQETATELLKESVGVMRVLEKARISAGISFE